MTTTLRHPRYRLDSWIAAGGMGEVWQATDTLLDREVAVKVLRSDLAADPVLRARFAAEARHAGALQHPNVASVLDYGELAGPGPDDHPTPFLVMELVDGQPLSALIAGRQRLEPQIAAALIAQAADGIEAAHALGIVHRDVKPGNLLVTLEGQVKVTDFGVARAADTASLTMTGHLIGTPHYLSPEQAEGGAATTVSDVYSLGIVLFECLTGRKPFAAETPVATALMQIREPLPALPDSVPERLQLITRIATAKEPAARFRSAGAMAAALRDDSADTRSYPLPASVVAASEPGPVPGGAPAPAADRRRGFGARGRRVLAGVLALLLVSGGVWAMTASTDERPSAGGAAAAVQDGDDTVRVRARDFVGRDVRDAVRALRDLGLRPRVERRANQGRRSPGTVAAVTPTGLVPVHTVVLLSVWARPSDAPQRPEAETAGPESPSEGDAAPGRGTPPPEESTGAARGSGQRTEDRPGDSPATSGSDHASPGGAPSGSSGPGGGNGGGNAGGGKGGGNAGGNGGGHDGARPGKGGKR